MKKFMIGKAMILAAALSVMTACGRTAKTPETTAAETTAAAETTTAAETTKAEETTTAAESTTEAAETAGTVGMANPWVESTAEEIMDKLGLSLKVPEGAEDVTYRMAEDLKMEEMTFKLDDLEFTARVKSTAEFEDISGLYYTWDLEDPCEVGGWCEGFDRRTKDGELTIDNVTWCDMVPGLSYSISTSAADLDGFDILGIANMVFEPAQGNS